MEVNGFLAKIESNTEQRLWRKSTHICP